jgi:pimeloyl-ACP methyl ester carboxylesterase
VDRRCYLLKQKMSVAAFQVAQSRMLARYGIEAESRFVEVPVVSGRAQVLTSGRGPDVLMINGIGTPAAMWAPLIADLGGFTLHAVDLPGYGLTDTSSVFLDSSTYREAAVQFLVEILDGLKLARAAFVANSLGSLWTLWLALSKADRVAAMAHIGCPAVCLGTSAPLPMRLLSVPWVARVILRLDPPSPAQVERLSKMVRQYPLIPELADLLLATERLPGFESTFLAALRSLLSLRGGREAMALDEDDFASISQPSLLIWGKDDPMGSPEVGERIVEAMPDAEFAVVEGGHTPWLRESPRIAPRIRSFLQDRYA